ncbi:MAG: molybdenum cofactor guanylyltransferase [Deltaproteobacteria bacterium]|nr:molybdenum cofactor guanylyltransferase [Deltaproteobacteria bacterium]
MAIDRLDVTGVILAGGRATRMGGFPKGLMRRDGRTLAERARDLLGAVTANVLLVANEERSYAGLGIPMIRDRIADLGPIGGLEAALTHVSTPWTIVVGCDMPLLSVAVLTLVRDRDERFDAVVPRIGEHLEPLCARYSRSILPVVRECIARGELGMSRLLTHLTVDELDEATLREVDPALEAIANVNTPEDADRMRVER